MNQRDLQLLLQKRYNSKNWQEILESIFPSVSFFIKPEIISVKNEKVKSFLQKGLVRLHDGKNLAVFEVILDEGINLLKNRVALRNLTTRFIDEAGTHGVLVIYDQGKSNYRFTFVAKDSGFSDTGGFVKFETESKRYTYILGEGESCRTAAERFARLANRRDKVTISDVMHAFSVEQLSNEFFKKYKDHYQLFTDFLLSTNHKVSIFNGNEKSIRDFVKKLLGRIVFLYFVQKKGWLGAKSTNYKDGDYNFMMNFWEQSGKNESFYPNYLYPLFFEGISKRRENDDYLLPNDVVCKIPYLNGGLFEQDEIEPLFITFPPSFFESLFDFFSSYNFTIDENDPEEHEIGIDPEMLGHIFENLLEDNKDKGAYYTPKEVVKHMTQECLIEYLLSNINSSGTVLSTDEIDALRSFVKYKLKGDELNESLLNEKGLASFYKNQIRFIANYGSQINSLLDSIKICDPAIGSGAFPVGLLNEIYHCKIVLNNTFLPEERFSVKKHIIENSIYGVDIEKGAVDIARLRFWLSLIIDQEHPSALPNFDYKIVIGDSVVSRLDDDPIEIDWNLKDTSHGLFGEEFAQHKAVLLKEISEKQKEFFNPDSAKNNLSSEIRHLKIELLINQLNLMINTKGIETKPSGLSQNIVEQTNLYLKTIQWKNCIKKLTDLQSLPDKSLNYFDWKLDFPEVMNDAISEKSGFDIVIGNPPYIGEKGNKHIFKVIRQGFLKEYYMGKVDIFYFFMHLGISLLKEKGTLSYITTNYYLTADGARILRRELRSKTKLFKLINFNEFKVFNSAKGQHNMITFLSKSNDDRECNVLVSTSSKSGDSNKLMSFLDCKSDEMFYYKTKSNDLFEGEENYIRLKVIDIKSDSLISLESILEKMQIDHKKLGDICNVNIGMRTGADKVSPKHLADFNIDAEKGDGIYVLSKEEVNKIGFNTEESKLLFPFFKNSDIRKYKVKEKNNLFLLGVIYPDLKDLDEKKYPNISKHLMKFEKILRNRKSNDNGLLNVIEQGYWWAFTLRQLDFDAPKIISPQRSLSNTFGYTEVTWYASMDVYYITEKNRDVNLKYILALLNSRLYYYWLYSKGKRKGNSLELYQTPLSHVPIKIIDKPSQLKYVTVVDDILDGRIDAEKGSRIIDQMVYKLYNLDNEEIQIIDSDITQKH